MKTMTYDEFVAGLWDLKGARVMAWSHAIHRGDRAVIATMLPDERDPDELEQDLMKEAYELFVPDPDQAKVPDDNIDLGWKDLGWDFDAELPVDPMTPEEEARKAEEDRRRMLLDGYAHVSRTMLPLVHAALASTIGKDPKVAQMVADALMTANAALTWDGTIPGLEIQLSGEDFAEAWNAGHPNGQIKIPASRYSW